MNAIGFLALIYVVVSTLAWAAREIHERRDGRIDSNWLRWWFVYLWPLVLLHHWYNLAMLRYYRRRTRMTFERFFGKAKAKTVMAMIDQLDRRP